MKNVILVLILSFLTFNTFGQKQYTDKKEYESALKYYNDAKDSYENYIKKLNYFKNYKFPKSKNYPPNGDIWYVTYFKKDLESLGVRLDNNETRLHKNVTPDDSLYINFIEVDDSPYLLIKVTNQKMGNDKYEFCCKTLQFKHPGKKPIYVEKKDSVKINVSVIKEEKKEPTQVVIKEPIKKEVKPSKYLMPDGKRYSYENLIRIYPSMSNNKVFSSYFGN